MSITNDGAAPTPQGGSASQPSGTPSAPASTPSAERPIEDQVHDLINGGGEPDPDGTLPPRADPGGDELEERYQEALRERGEEPEEKPGPASAKDALEALIATDKAAAYDVAIFNTGDGEPVTLGQLKDAWQDRETATRETVAKAAALDARESEILAHQTLISEMGDAIETHIPPELVSQYASRMQAEAGRERRKALETMPELADPTVYEAFRNEAAEYVKQFGYRPEELVIRDHRMLRVLKQAMNDRKRLQKLLDFKPAHKAPASLKQSARRGDGGGETQQAIERAKKTGSQGDQLAAISKLIGG